MSKDVLYIDVEDDITAIIGKVKASDEKIIAIVPPKRVGVLQSAVNLRLLNRAAEQSGKRLVLITSNAALTALAAAAAIPIAKNLQTKPELAEIPVLDIDDGDDVIDGSSLPVGDHAKVAGADDDDASEVDALISGVDVEKDDVSSIEKPKKKSSGTKVPDFNKFRKRLIIGIAAAVLLIGVLIWAFVFAPRATVVIKARTTPVPVNSVVVLGTETSATNGTVKAELQTIERDASVDFEATGEEDRGEKATGSVRIRTSAETILLYGLTVPRGTVIESSGGKTYQTTSAATFPQGSASTLGGVVVGVTATGAGESYNAATGAATTLASGVTSVSFTEPTSGGTTKIVNTVTAADVQAAKEKLVAQPDDAVKKELEAKFSDDVAVISESFFVERADATSAPAVGQEAPDKKAKLTSKTTYRLNGVARSSVAVYATETLKAGMQDQTTQKIYSTGEKSVKFSDFRRVEATLSVRLSTTGRIGPVINEDKIKEEVAGKRYGDIRDQLSRIEGVSDVEVKFPYFWVRTVPTNLERITVEFEVEDTRG